MGKANELLERQLIDLSQFLQIHITDACISLVEPILVNCVEYILFSLSSIAISHPNMPLFFMAFLPALSLADPHTCIKSMRQRHHHQKTSCMKS